MSRLPAAFPPGTPVLDVTAPDFVEQLSEAIGIQPDDTIQITTPQFHRSPGEPAPIPPPEPFDRVRELSHCELKSMGCKAWDEPDASGTELLLFPGEWYRSIPAGFEVVDINDCVKPFVPGDDDIRFGVLSFGIRVQAPAKPPTPSEVAA